MERLTWQSEPVALERGAPPGAAPLVFLASSTAADGARLELRVYGERPKPWSRLHLQSSAQPPPAAWLLTSTGRPPGLLELMDAVNEAGRRLPEWWAVVLPWSCNLDPAPGDVTPEAFYVRGMFLGPVPLGTRVLAALELGTPAAQPPEAPPTRRAADA